MTTDAMAKQAIERWQQLRGERRELEQLWQRVVELVAPSRSFVMYGKTGPLGNRKRLYSDKTPRAAKQLAQAIHGLLFNPAIRWLYINALEPTRRVMNDLEVQRWYWLASTVILDYLNSPLSHFAISSAEIAYDEVCFGIGNQYVCRKPGQPARYLAKPMSNYYILENGEDEEKTGSYRSIHIAAEEAAKMFPEGLSKETYDLANHPHGRRTKVTILHEILRRNYQDGRGRHNVEKPWASTYYEVDRCKTIKVSGFDEDPHLNPRWEKSTGDIYGSCPAIDTLPTTASLNAIKKILLIGAELEIAPPIGAESGSYEGEINVQPYGFTYFKKGTKQWAKALELAQNLQFGYLSVADHEAAIDDGFFLNRLRLPEKLQRATTMEVIARRQDNLVTASPIISRQHEEWLLPLVQNAYYDLRAFGMIPEPPARIRGKPMKIYFVSPLMNAQRGQDNQNFLQAVSILEPLIKFDPGIMANFDAEEIVRGVWRDSGANPWYLHLPSTVEELRRQNAQTQETDVKLNQVKTLAEAAKNAAAASHQLSNVDVRRAA